MILHLCRETIDAWTDALVSAGSKEEIGGILYGEHLGEGNYLLIKATIQDQNGRPDDFVLDLEQGNQELSLLRKEHPGGTLLGHWHSHPPEDLTEPSLCDRATMSVMLKEEREPHESLLLLIIRMNPEGVLEICAREFRGNGNVYVCCLKFNDSDDDRPDRPRLSFL